MNALTIPASEQGQVRVFALDMPGAQARFLRDNNAAGEALGGVRLDPTYVDIFALGDLEELGLPGYLIDGCGVPADQIAPDSARLNALTGSVMIVLSRAFGGRATTLHPAGNLRLIATYSVPPTDWSAAPMRTGKPLAMSPAKPSPRAARNASRRIGAAIFGIVMVLIVIAIVLVLT